jgi:hypothetical protein
MAHVAVAENNSAIPGQALRLHTSSIGRRKAVPEADGRVPVPKLFQKSKYLRKKGFYFERRQIPEIYARLWKV